MAVKTYEQTAADIVRHLAAYTATGGIGDIADARHLIKELHKERVPVAKPLWEVALYLQHALVDLNGDDDASE